MATSSSTPHPGTGQRNRGCIQHGLTNNIWLSRRPHIKKTICSIELGLGPPALKGAFIVEDLAPINTRINTEPINTDWTEDLYECVLATLVCCWWMLRGIEMPASRRQHSWFKHTNFGNPALPKDRHCWHLRNPFTSVPLPQPDPHLYHALEQLIVRITRQRSGNNQDNAGYFFPGTDGGAISHASDIEIFRKASQPLGPN